MGQIDAAFTGRTVPSTPTLQSVKKRSRSSCLVLVEARGEHGLLFARKHMSWPRIGFSDASHLRHALMRAPTSAEALDLLDRQLQELD